MLIFKCKKCGNENQEQIGLEFFVKRHPDGEQYDQEVLRVICKRCTYQWTEPCLDTMKEKKKEKETMEKIPKRIRGIIKLDSHSGLLSNNSSENIVTDQSGMKIGIVKSLTEHITENKIIIEMEIF